MPYIKQEERAEIEPNLPIYVGTAGKLNFLITRLVSQYIKNQGKNYAILNEAIGVLECVKLELYRRIVSPYENTKMAENGDVYFEIFSGTNNG